MPAPKIRVDCLAENGTIRISVGNRHPGNLFLSEAQYAADARLPARDRVVQALADGAVELISDPAHGQLSLLLYRTAHPMNWLHGTVTYHDRPALLRATARLRRKLALGRVVASEGDPDD